MLDKLRKILDNYRQFLADRQAPPKKSPPPENEAICHNGLIGLGAIWEAYDMWI